MVPERGRVIPTTPHIEEDLTSKRELPRPPTVIDTPQPTTVKSVDTDKSENARFMMTWGDYLAEAGLTDDKHDKKQNKKSNNVGISSVRSHAAIPG